MMPEGRCFLSLEDLHDPWVQHLVPACRGVSVDVVDVNQACSWKWQQHICSSITQRLRTGTHRGAALDNALSELFAHQTQHYWVWVSMDLVLKKVIDPIQECHEEKEGRCHRLPQLADNWDRLDVVISCGDEERPRADCWMECILVAHYCCDLSTAGVQ